MCLRATTGLLLICMAAALYQTGPVQAIEKPLTNTDVAKMLKAGLAEHTITFAIQLAIERGNADFDSAPEALIELKNTGATEEILNAILYASTLPPRYVPSKTVLGLPEHPGLYHQAEAGWTALDQVLLWPEIRTTWTWRTASDHRRYFLAGGQARLRITASKPSFYLRDPNPERGWGLLRLIARRDHRELQTMIPDVFSFSRRVEFEAGERLDLEAAALAADVLRLRPASELAPGEYLLFKWVPGQQWLIVGYEFRVGTT